MLAKSWVTLEIKKFIKGKEEKGKVAIEVRQLDVWKEKKIYWKFRRYEKDIIKIKIKVHQKAKFCPRDNGTQNKE